MDHFADIPTHSAKRHKSCQILSPSQNTLSDTQQYVTNTAKFCSPLKTTSQTPSNTSTILSNSVPLLKRPLRHPVKRQQSCQILSPLKTHSQTSSQTSSILSNSVPQTIYTQYAVSRFRSDRALILGNCYHTTNAFRSRVARLLFGSHMPHPAYSAKHAYSASCTDPL